MSSRHITATQRHADTRGQRPIRGRPTPAPGCIGGGEDDKKSSGKGGSRRERRKPVELRAGVNVCCVTSSLRAGTFMGRAAGTGRSPWRGDLVRGGTRSSSQTRASERERERARHRLPGLRSRTTITATYAKFLNAARGSCFRVPCVAACLPPCLLACLLRLLSCRFVVVVVVVGVVKT